MSLNQNVPNPRYLCRGFARFQEIISAAESPVVLLEGSRNVPVAVALKMEQLAAFLMKKFPALIVRSLRSHLYANPLLRASIIILFVFHEMGLKP